MIDEIYDGLFDSENGFLSEFINFSFIAFDTYYTHLNLNFSHSIVESVDIPNNFGSDVAIPRVEDSNDVNSNFNIFAQNNNQYSYLDVILSIKKRPREHIMTFNDSAEFF